MTTLQRSEIKTNPAKRTPRDVKIEYVQSCIEKLKGAKSIIMEQVYYILLYDIVS